VSIFEAPGGRAPRPCPLRVAILGCTGSVGRQALDVCRRHPDRLQVTALSAYRSVAQTLSAAREFGVAHVAFADEQVRHDPALAELPQGCELGFGSQAAADLARLDDVDAVLVSVVGAAGIHASLAALEAGKIVCPANKEALVVGGELLMPLARPGRLIPVDSEHSAIYQCLVGERREDAARVWLTCSGGPFRGRSRAQLAQASAAEALAHPTWKMGPKITIDCATLMNKGLEVIEAHHLFGLPYDAITVLVHPQSLVHSMVEFADGSVKAQLGPADMREAIQYAFSYPERWSASVTPVDFWEVGSVSFEAPDTQAFACLDLAVSAGRAGGTLPCAMNAANEVANRAFREERVGFLDVARIVEQVMGQTVREPVESLGQLMEVDARARALARAFVEERA